MHRLASTIAALGLLACALCGCSQDHAGREALVEANLLSSGIYQIQITGNNPLITFAYQSKAIHLGDKTQWEGCATVGAYDLAWQQECISIYSPTVKAKQWRGKWVHSTATTPTAQMLLWLQEVSAGKGEISNTPSAPPDFLSSRAGEGTQVICATLQDAPIFWNAICDAHLDTFFGGQAFLTDIKSAAVTLYFDAATYALIGVQFQGKQAQTAIEGKITLSAADGQSITEFPLPKEISDGTLSEEWQILRES